MTYRGFVETLDGRMFDTTLQADHDQEALDRTEAWVSTTHGVKASEIVSTGAVWIKSPVFYSARDIRCLEE